jgi:hypothetical protein
MDIVEKADERGEVKLLRKYQRLKIKWPNG